MRALNLERLWSWLPAFRIIAEHGQVRQAALVMHVSPSALSRTLRLLEDSLGEPLFDRLPGGLRLTNAGSALLAATRDAMRTIDDGVSAARAKHVDLRVTADPTVELFVGIACGHLLQEGAAASVAVVHMKHDVSLAAVLRGELDVAVMEGGIGDSPSGIELVDVGVIETAAYLGKRAATHMLRAPALALIGAARSGHTVVLPSAIAVLAGLGQPGETEKTPAFAARRSVRAARGPSPVDQAVTRLIDLLVNALVEHRSPGESTPLS